MPRYRFSTPSKIKALTALAACLGLMAVGASSASAAATPIKFNLTGTSGRVLIYSGGNGGIQCERLTITGQVTQPAAYPTEPKTGTVTGITPTKCIDQFWNLPMAVSLKTPWTISISGSGVVTINNFNLHIALPEAPNSIYWDLVGPTHVGWLWTTSNPLTATNVAAGDIGSGFAQPGPAYMEGGFSVSYTKAS